MPKSKKSNKTNIENRTAWRSPVKLPTTAAVEPMKSLYFQSDTASENDQTRENVADEPVIQYSPENAETGSELRENAQSLPETKIEEPERKQPTSAKKQKVKIAIIEPTHSKNDITSRKLGEAEFLRLLKTEKMDFYSLAEILRGSSMALYCVLYSESLAKGENRCQIRQTELMMRAGINNPATLYKQERWLTVLGLISKSVRLGNHNGASYEVYPLKALPLPDFIIDQFDGYLTELNLVK